MLSYKEKNAEFLKCSGYYNALFLPFELDILFTVAINILRLDQCAWSNP